MKPYIIRAVYDWLHDANLTAHLLVNALDPKVDVPQEHVRNGQIVLNIAGSAVIGFLMDNEAVSFSARFGGVPRTIYVPIRAVLGIYARENNQGMFFDPELEDPEPPEEKQKSVPEASAPRPSLRVVK